MSTHSGERVQHQLERTYLLREGHFLGFGMGLLLSRWWWAAVAWGAVLLALWARSISAALSGRSEGQS